MNMNIHLIDSAVPQQDLAIFCTCYWERDGMVK